MFDWFRKKKERREFPDNASAFEHACSCGYAANIDALIPALVEEEGGLGQDGERTYLIRIADKEGPREVWSCTLKETLGYPKQGDLVGFRIVMIADDLPEPANLLGFIACKLAPIHVSGKGWIIAQNYTPKNIKQAIRF